MGCYRYDPESSVYLIPVIFNWQRNNIHLYVYEEVEFELGAHPAEVGQTDSTYINIVSKGGGNTFTGGAYLYLTGSGLTTDLIPKSDTTAYQVDPPGKYASYSDLSANIGGPFLADRAWFYLNGRWNSWRQTTSVTPEVRMVALGFYGVDYAHYDYDHDELFGFSKLTIQIDKNIRYMGMLHYNNIYEPIYQISGVANISVPATESWDHERD